MYYNIILTEQEKKKLKEEFIKDEMKNVKKVSAETYAIDALYLQNNQIAIKLFWESIENPSEEKLNKVEEEILNHSKAKKTKSGYKTALRKMAKYINKKYGGAEQYLLHIDKLDKAEKQNNIVDSELNENIEATIKKEPYNNERQKAGEPIEQNGVKIYPRDSKLASNALAHAEHQCEFDKSHESFIRKKKDLKYMEAHHLIPMNKQGDFTESLDREHNIVSLCSECHNRLHYGRDRDDILSKLYKERKEKLENIGIEITYEELLEYY